MKVAFKFFLEHAEQRKNNFDVEQLLKDVDRHNQYQKVYEAVRKEVSFLAKLKHNHLTKLVGVATSPRVCMVLELAPKGSLRDILKEYNKSGNPLLPLTMKMCAEQVSSHRMGNTLYTSERGGILSVSVWGWGMHLQSDISSHHCR